MKTSTVLTDFKENGYPPRENSMEWLRIRLEQIRIDNDLEIKDFCKKVGCSKKTRDKWINGTNNPATQKKHYAMPKIEVLNKICDEFGVSLDYLFGRTDFTTPDNKLISQVTGLTDASIENLKALHIEWFNDVIARKLEFDMSAGDIARTPRKMHQTLNTLLSSPCFNKFLHAYNDFLNPQYCIPVHYQETKPGSKSGWYENNQKVYAGSDTYISFACDKNNLSDTRETLIDENFMQAVALKNIEQCLTNIKNEQKTAQKKTTKKAVK